MSETQQERTELIRRLGSSKFNYWFGYLANISLVVWLCSHAFRGGRSVLGREQWLVWSTVGFLSWSLSEWLLHRYVYHLWPTFLSEGHALHHHGPRDLIGVPWYLTTVGLIAIFEGLALVTRPHVTGVVMGFNWLGYILYCIAHHGSHHWSLRWGWFKRMKRHHLLHHVHPAYNWGFTTPIWDHIFGTHYDRRRVAQTAATDQ